MAVEGRIQTGSYVRQDGTKVYTTDVIVENAEFADSKAPGQGQQMQGGQGFQGQQYQQQGQGFGQYQQNQNSQYQGYSGQGGQNGQYGQYGGFGNQGYQQGGGQNYGLNSYQSQGGVTGGYTGGMDHPDSSSQDFGSSQADTGYGQSEPPMQEAADEGFMQIPDAVNDEGLPFG